jgi:hypothetical protein
LKYLFLPLIIFLASCSLNKDTAYWNEDRMKKTIDKKLSLILKKKTISDYKDMTFNEFNIFIKDYSYNAEYPDINK